MAIKIIVILVFLMILFNLGTALVYMMKDGGQGDRMARALTWRIGLSVAAFILLLAAFGLGWIEPHGITPPASPTPGG
ncbi:MAG TPA: twin transmembrane helix small protein [Gammaproteobacteria bacterium]|nr:twin transmembrane helix small protein [Gammaproteobacteria bacterium]